MYKYFICCEECFDLIARQSSKAVRLWMDLCLAHSQRRSLRQSNIITLNISDCQEVRLLEMLGFIVSMETSSKVSLKVKGHMLTDDGQDFFCVEGGIHERD